ncbi:hypothetical protein B6U80_02375 [Candidatus Pacearchaeota archaeon ex4484_26]|nr:MAG: hypothetical protein B6U80_02375 [Candidatus Pacearchaeota archaeon ex4484_26]
MAKISPVSIKYIIRAKFFAEGTVEKPDVIGAIFGQTEGLLGESLELRELQKEGKIGRIEVTLETEKGSTTGIIEIPTSLDKAETALIGAALETIERVGPSEATIKVETIEDVRASKREYVVERAKRLLKDFQERELPETSELKTTITDTVRMMEVTEYGRERLTAGPEIDEANEVIIVEGRADVMNLLRCGIKNVIALNGTSVPETIKVLSEEKIATLFVDGDRGGDLIVKDVASTCDIAFVARAPDGKEVEELTKKEILKALRDKVRVGEKKPAATFKVKEFKKGERYVELAPRMQKKRYRSYDPYRNAGSRMTREKPRKEIELSKKQKEVLEKIQEEIIGTRGAYLLDNKLEILGKVPLSELATTLKNIKAYAIVADGIITSQMATVAEQSGVGIILAKDFVRKGNFKALTFKEVERI